MKKNEKIMIFMGAIVILALLIIDAIMTDKAIDQCINSGNNIEYCTKGLR